MEPVQLPHRFIEKQRNDPAVHHPPASLILPSKAEAPDDFPPLVILLKRQLHAVCIGCPTAKTGIISLRFQSLDRHSFSAPLVLSCRSYAFTSPAPAASCVAF